MDNIRNDIMKHLHHHPNPTMTGAHLGHGPPPLRLLPPKRRSKPYTPPRPTTTFPALRGLLQQPRPRPRLHVCDMINPPQGVGGVRCYWALLVPQYSAGPDGGSNLELKFVYLDPVLNTHLGRQSHGVINHGLIDLIHPTERERESYALRIGRKEGGRQAGSAWRGGAVVPSARQPLFTRASSRLTLAPSPRTSVYMRKS